MVDARPEAICVRFLGSFVAIESNAPDVMAWCQRYYRQMLTSESAASFCLSIDRRGDTYHFRAAGQERSVHTSVDGAVRALNAELLYFLESQQKGLFWFHAAACAWSQRVVILPGPSRRGKSTIGALLYGLGWTYLADETLAIDFATSTAIPFPLTPAFRARGSEAPTLDQPLHSKRSVELTADRVARQPMEIGAVVFPQYMGSGGTRILRVSPAVGALELVLNCRHEPGDRSALLSGAGWLATHVPVFRLEYHDSDEAADHLDRVLRAHRTI